MADVLPWLLDSDPALRWQVERDLAGEPPAVWQATRARVATEGFGARLLALQDPDGQWAGGAYFPADFRGSPEDGQPWTATTWSLNALRDWGLDPAVLAGTAELLARNSRWEYENLPYWGGEVDVCINSWTLSNGLWLGADVHGIAEWFVEHRLPDGGWNCLWVEGARRSSVHSTLNALKALLDYEVAGGDAGVFRSARLAGQEYLLSRKLFRRLSDGEPIAPWTLLFSYPFRWFYDVLNAADYFRTAALVDGTAPDPRMAEAIEAIRAARRPDGTWQQSRSLPGEVWFEVDSPAGEPSKWLTFHAMRVLDWWDCHAR
ncbi:squalene cyclase [Amycolatopsis sp. NPDC004368]